MGGVVVTDVFFGVVIAADMGKDKFLHGPVAVQQCTVCHGKSQGHEKLPGKYKFEAIENVISSKKKEIVVVYSASKASTLITRTIVKHVLLRVKNLYPIYNHLAYAKLAKPAIQCRRIHLKGLSEFVIIAQLRVKSIRNLVNVSVKMITLKKTLDGLIEKRHIDMWV